MFPFSTVLALWNVGVHIHAMNSGNVLSKIEVSVDDILCGRPTLQVPDINPNYCYIRFERDFDVKTVLLKMCISLRTSSMMLGVMGPFSPMKESPIIFK